MSGVTNKLMSASGGVAGPVEAQAVDFDGTSDYLSRSIDLTGAVDSKTFTFSMWIYRTHLDGESSGKIVELTDSIRFYFQSTYFYVLGSNSSGSTAVFLRCSENLFPVQTWSQVVVSVDTATSSASIYVNDALATLVTNTINNLTVDFTRTATTYWAIGCQLNTSATPVSFFKGRLSNVFLDYTYRDLSVEANRRLFITDEGTPASGQASLNPILYVPMDDPADVGRNDGTGGNFTLNGIVARSGRGPNQYNAAASTFDGVADYLSKTSLTGIADGKVFTASFSIKQKDFLSSGAYQYVFAIKQTGSVRFGIRFDTAGNLQVFGANSGGATRLLSLASKANMGYADNKYIHVAISFDMADPAKRRCFVNGQSVSISASTHDNEDLDFTTPEYAVGAQTGPSEFLDGELSDLWFNTTYIDLATNNPFYDTETDKPKFLGEFGELPTGSAPLIYLPLRADDAGNNKGTGGDFTVNSGPYIGARGPSEFWGEAAEFNGTNQEIYNLTTGFISPAGKQFTTCFSFFVDDVSSNRTILSLGGGSSTTGLLFFIEAQVLKIHGYNGANTTLALDFSYSSISAGSWYTVIVSCDMNNSSKRHVYVNGASVGTFNRYDNLNIDWTDYYTSVGFQWAGGRFDGEVGFLWFNTEYTDFSQEANRLKFFDAFNYPIDVGVDGSLPTGNVPLIYMNEDFHLGTNYGSGGNFTPVNAPTDGGYVKG